MKPSKLLGLFCFTMALYGIMLTVTIPHLQSLSGSKNLFDLGPIFNHEEAKNLLNSLGSDGRAYYLTKQLPLDCLYLISYGISYHYILSYFIQSLPKVRWRFLIYLPIIAAICDVIENSLIGLSLLSFPKINSLYLTSLPILTLLKMFFGSTYLLLFFGLGTMLLCHSLKRKV